MTCKKQSTKMKKEITTRPKMNSRPSEKKQKINPKKRNTQWPINSDPDRPNIIMIWNKCIKNIYQILPRKTKNIQNYIRKIKLCPTQLIPVSEQLQIKKLELSLWDSKSSNILKNVIPEIKHSPRKKKISNNVIIS